MIKKKVTTHLSHGGSKTKKNKTRVNFEFQRWSFKITFKITTGVKIIIGKIGSSVT